MHAKIDIYRRRKNPTAFSLELFSSLFPGANHAGIDGKVVKDASLENRIFLANAMTGVKDLHSLFNEIVSQPLNDDVTLSRSDRFLIDADKQSLSSLLQADTTSPLKVHLWKQKSMSV